jgi:hypothetical protein
MIHLLYSTIILCTIFGLFLSKNDKTSFIRKKRQHFKPLSLDKNLAH